jgi:predicted enzyme related to lactoylglutathione lyase
MGHSFVHVEVNTRDIERSRRFYETVFGWDIQHWNSPDSDVRYAMFETERGPGGGGIAQVGSDGPIGVTVYLNSDNLQESLSKIEAAGGRTVMPPAEVPGEGSFALFADPDGNTLGLWKSKNGS